MKTILQWYFASLAVLSVAALALTQLATDAQQGVVQQNLIILLYIDIALIIVMLITVVVMGIKLYRAKRSNRRGANLSWRLTLLLLTLALAPVSVLYIISANSVFRSIESWFDTPLDSAFDKGNEFSQRVIGSELTQLEFVSRDIANHLARRGINLPFGIDQLLAIHQVDSIGLYGNDGQLLLSSGTRQDWLILNPTLLSVLAREGRYYSVQRRTARIVLEVVVATPNLRDTAYISVSRPLDEDITEGVLNIEEGWEDYKQLKILRSGLRTAFLITLSLSLVLILLVVSWIAITLGRRLASPLVQLSAVAGAIGTGDFSKRVREVSSVDEINLVNKSFNKMANDLRKRQLALQTANAYLENLLSAISVGILSFAKNGTLELCNRSAAVLFGLDEMSDEEQKRLTIAQFCQRLTPEQAEELQAHLAPAPSEKWAEMRLSRAKGQVLLLRIVLLSEPAGGGALLVASDITQQIQKERGMTWEEASKRLAHEIKNPLTPIQLAAERLEHKLGSKLDAEDSTTLHRLVETIVNQVTAMRQMINAFREYATEQQFVWQAVDLNALIEEVLNLYEDRAAHFKTSLQANLPPAAGDPVQLRQALHNLIKNACEATADAQAPRISLRTQFSNTRETIMLTITDNGGGIPDELLSTICEPYVTTKSDGSGLGLAVIRKTIDEHQGQLQIENTSDGAQITLHLLPHTAADSPIPAAKKSNAE